MDSSSQTTDSSAPKSKQKFECIPISTYMIADVIGKPTAEIASIAPSATLQQVIKQLHQTGYRGLCVMEDDKFLGYINFRDILVNALDLLSSAIDENQQVHHNQIDPLNQKFASLTVKDVMNTGFSSKPEFSRVYADDHIKHLLKMFSQHRMHAVVFDKSDKIVGIVSPTAFLSWLYERFDFESYFKDQTLAQISGIKKNIGAVPEHMTCFQAFKLMMTYGIGVLGVVRKTAGEKDQLIDMLSESDILGVCSNENLDLRRFLNTVAKIKEQRRSGNTSKSANGPSKVLTAHRDDLFLAAVKTIVSNKIHRMIVMDNVNDQSKLVDSYGVISMSDIFKVFGSRLQDLIQ